MITLNFYQAKQLIELFSDSDDDIEITLQIGDDTSHSGAGLYAWFSDMPEEGAFFLGSE